MTVDLGSEGSQDLLYAQPELRQTPVTVTVGICATTELENTLKLTKQILGLAEEGLEIVELIVVTPNQKLVEELTGPDSRLVVFLENPRQGKASALNRIITYASGEVLVLASADVRLARSTISRLVRELVSSPERGAVDSRVELINGDRLLMDRVSTLLWNVHNSNLDLLDGNDRLGHVAGDLLAVRRRLVGPLPDVINDDAYLALKIREEGFLVKRIPDALVWICGPRSPADYVYQRSRVLRGHLQLIRLTGRTPTTFEFSIPKQPRRSLRTLVSCIGGLGPSFILPLLVAGLLELVSFTVAISYQATRRPVKPWRIVHSTKQV